MRVFVTKYALTDGIQEGEADETVHGTSFLVKLPGRHFHAYFSPRDCFTDYELAVKRANEMRVKKIASLKEKIAKLESRVFK